MELGIRKLAISLLIMPLLSLGLCGCSLLGLAGAALPYAGIKVYFACVPEGTSVDTPSGPCQIEALNAGELVIGFEGSPVRVLQKHAYLESPETVFLRLVFADGATVDVCKQHRVDGTRAGDVRPGQKLAGRVVTRIEPHRGVTRSYDLLTEDAGYRIQGVSVNSMIEEMHAASRSGKCPK
jgi:hypothetical protein